MAYSSNINFTPATAPRFLWSETLDVIDVCWLRIDQTAALLYTSDSGVNLLSLEGDNLDLRIDTWGIKWPRCVACSTSGQTIVVTDGHRPHSWTVYHKQVNRHNVPVIQYDRRAKYPIESWPVSVILNSVDDVLMLTEKRPPDTPGSRNLQRYRLDGELVWEEPGLDLGSFYPGALTVDSKDNAYVCVAGRVEVYNPGEQIDSGTTSGTTSGPEEVFGITAVCVDSNGQQFTSEACGSVSLFRGGEIVRQRLIETSGERVKCMCLYRDTYLVLAIDDKLNLYKLS